MTVTTRGTIRTTIRWNVLALAMLCLVSACATLPPDTRTGNTFDILITEADIQPRDIVVQLGDEVRFRNERFKPVYVFFFMDFSDELSCQRGFSLFWGAEEEAKIEPAESASLCFARPGTVGFSVQFEVTDFGGIGGTPGEINVPAARSGAIVVKGPARP